MAFPSEEFYNYLCDGSFPSSFTPPQHASFNENIYSTTIPFVAPPFLFWCSHCQTTNHPPGNCPALGLSLGLGQNQNYGPTSEPYNSNIEYWNNQQFLLDQPNHTFQSNWSYNDPTLPSSALNNCLETQHDDECANLFPELSLQLEILKQTVAQNQIHSEVDQQSNPDSQQQIFFNEQSSLSLGVGYDYVKPDPPLPPGTLEACLENLKEAQNKLASQTKSTHQSMLSMFETNQQILESCDRMQLDFERILW